MKTLLRLFPIALFSLIMFVFAVPSFAASADQNTYLNKMNSYANTKACQKQTKKCNKNKVSSLTDQAEAEASADNDSRVTVFDKTLERTERYIQLDRNDADALHEHVVGTLQRTYDYQSAILDSNYDYQTSLREAQNALDDEVNQINDDYNTRVDSPEANEVVKQPAKKKKKKKAKKSSVSVSSLVSANKKKKKASKPAAPKLTPQAQQERADAGAEKAQRVDDAQTAYNRLTTDIKAQNDYDLAKIDLDNWFATQNSQADEAYNTTQRNLDRTAAAAQDQHDNAVDFSSEVMQNQVDRVNDVRANFGLS